MPGVLTICSTVASSRASIERNCCARLRPVTKPTPSRPIANRTRENGRDFDSAIEAMRIAESKSRPFSRVLFAIGLEGVGFVTGRSLAQQFRSIDALLEATVEQIVRTPGIGPIVAQLIHDHLREPQLIALIEDLRSLGLRFEEQGPPPGEG